MKNVTFGHTGFIYDDSDSKKRILIGDEERTVTVPLPDLLLFVAHIKREILTAQLAKQPAAHLLGPQLGGLLENGE